MDYGIFNVCTNVNACNRTRGRTDTVRESALKVDSGRKIPCAASGNRTCVGGVPVRFSTSWAVSSLGLGLLHFRTAVTLKQYDLLASDLGCVCIVDEWTSNDQSTQTIRRAYVWLRVSSVHVRTCVRASMYLNVRMCVCGGGKVWLRDFLGVVIQHCLWKRGKTLVCRDCLITAITTENSRSTHSTKREVELVWRVETVSLQTDGRTATLRECMC